MALTRIKNKALSSLLDANEDVNSANLDNVPASDDASALTTGTLPDARLSNQVKVVKAGSAPGSPQEGDLWYDTTNEVLKVYDATVVGFVKVSTVTPTLDTVTGSILNSFAGDLTLAGTGFLLAGLDVKFTPSGGSTTTVSVTPTSDTAATVAVPSAIYNLAADTVIAITVTNSDGKTSAGVNKTIVALPTGGTITTTGSYRVHTFTSSGTFVNTIADLSVQYLVIGGGGGSGRQHGGGGGAGGYRSSVPGETSGAGSSVESVLTLSVGNKTVTIGAGGAAGGAPPAKGGDGGDSVFDTITSTGGGGGGGYQTSTNSAGNGNPGGSGGGGGCAEGGGSGCATGNDGGAGTANQGMAGGKSSYAGAGGGGSSQVGEQGCGGSPCGDGGNGGAGEDSAITGSTVGRAGGGAGGSYGGSNQSCGSRGIATDGGGNGGWGAEGGTNGTANTGGGAGGGGVLAYGASSGGSGIVIVRYIP